MIVTLILLIICSPFLWWYLFVLPKYKSLRNIPGPRPLPIIGNAFDIGNTPQDFYKNFNKLSKQYGDVFKLYVGNQPRIFITRPELLEAIMSSNIHITKSNAYDQIRKWLGEGLLISIGKKWKGRRRMITPTFHFKILEQFVDVFNSCGDILIKKLSNELGKNSVEIYPHVNLCALDIICQTAMGMKYSFQEGGNDEYVTTVRSYMEMVMLRFFSGWQKFDFLYQFSKNWQEYNRLLKILLKFSHETINKRREERSHEKQKVVASADGTKRKVALLDMLLESEDSHMLDDVGVMDEINTFMFGGHDTTSSGISFALLALADHPEIQERVYEEINEVIDDVKNITMQDLQNMRYLEMVIKETQRVYPSVPLVERRLETDWSIGGYDFPKNTILDLFIYGTHRNEHYFPDPEKFDPDRFLPENQAKRHNYVYIPFSAGPRNCIGQKFAMLSMKTIVIKVVKNFRLTPVADYKPVFEMVGTLKSTNGVCVQLHSRS